MTLKDKQYELVRILHQSDHSTLHRLPPLIKLRTLTNETSIFNHHVQSTATRHMSRLSVYCHPIPIISAFKNRTQPSLPLPRPRALAYKPSTLALSLCVCLFAPEYLMTSTLAAPANVPSTSAALSTSDDVAQSLSRGGDLNTDLQDVLTDDNTYMSEWDEDDTSDVNIGNTQNTDIRDDEQQLDQALTALKLKQAVERGDLPASVLEDFKRETLNSDNKSSNLSQSESKASRQQTALSGQSDNGTGLDADLITSEPELSVSSPQEFDEQFSRLEQSNPVPNVNIDALMSHNKTAATPEQIERALAQVEASLQLDMEASFDRPVATLDSNVPPIGLDQTLDSINLPAPITPPIVTGLDTPTSITARQNSNQRDGSVNLDAQRYRDEKVNTDAIDAVFEASEANDYRTANQQASSRINEQDNTQFDIAQPTQPDVVENKVAINSANNADASTFSPDAISAQSPRTATNTVPVIEQVPVVVGYAESGNVPLGEDLTNTDYERVNATANMSTSDISSVGKVDELNPNDYIPNYQASTNTTVPLVTPDTAAATVEEDDEPGLFEGLYSRLFNRSGLPKIDANMYLQDETQLDANGRPLLIKADDDVQPVMNIKAAMENITVQAISDFATVLPKLREEALNASQAVGYYDIKLRFVKRDSDDVDVIIERLGEPIRVESRIVDIRGGAADLDVFKQIQAAAPPKKGEVLNQGVYKQTKATIESESMTYGFFDSAWLDSSVDIILPDNTADVSLIYDSDQRYKFDDVTFFTLDDSGRMTSNPDDLPVKIELLHQLHNFKQGDSFYQPLVTEFTNDLAATRYFNTVNVEAVLPPSADDIGTVEFEGSLGGRSSGNGEVGVNSEDSDSLNATGNAVDNNTSENNGNGLSGLAIQDAANVNDDQSMASSQSDNMDNVDDANLRPIEYTLDDETSERMQAIITKAERLTRLPDDRVLDAKEEEAKNLLGKISDGFSNLVAKILPDGDDDDLDSIDELPDNLEDIILAERKTPQAVAEDKQVPLYVFVAAPKPRDAEFGIGYGTDTGIRGIARLENNLINRDGYQAGATLEGSGITQRVSIHGSRPWKHPLDDILTANISYENEQLNQGEGNIDLSTHTIQGIVAREIHSDTGWDRTYSLRYRQDDLESGVSGPNREGLPIPFNRNDSRFKQQALLFGYTLERTDADNDLVPTDGLHQYYSIEAGKEGILTDTDMAILRAGVDGIYTFGESGKHQVVGGFDTGYILADIFEEVPYQLRFFAGGDRSIRGYDYKSLSAKENGYLVGGQILAVGSAEYNYEFKEGIRGAVFADVGNAYDKDFNTDTKLGLGVGVRWASPVGIVRVDVAAGVLENSIPVRLHIFIGSPLL